MRQVGVLGACGLIALRDMVARLKDDHSNARLLAGNLQRDNLTSKCPRGPLHAHKRVFELHASIFS